jgi:alpha-L-fucosidase
MFFLLKLIPVLKYNLFSISAILFITVSMFCCTEPVTIPSYLENYRDEYNANPRKANLKWFTDARYGMFIHYGLYALLEKGEWVQLRDTIPVAEYAKLKDRFTAENFDADSITQLALDAGMKYITFTSKHHDGFCLFNTKETDFNVLNSPAKRDLIKDLYDACKRKGLGLFLYYSYGADWKHPYFYPRERGWKHARPAYQDPQPEYKFEKDEDFEFYVKFVHEQLTELLTQYPDIAGIWFDPIMGYYSNPDLFPVDSTYALVRQLSPHALISFKQGANGEEDFMAPERKGAAMVGQQFEVARKVYEKNKNKPREICNTLQPHAWGYNKSDDGHHKNADEVMQMLKDAEEMNANLLLNIGPKGDGSIPDEDVSILKEVGKKLSVQ